MECCRKLSCIYALVHLMLCECVECVSRDQVHCCCSLFFSSNKHMVCSRACSPLSENMVRRCSYEHIRCSGQAPSAHHMGKWSEDVSKEHRRRSAQGPATHRWRNCYGVVSKESVRWSAQPRPHRWEKSSEYDSKDFIKPSQCCEKLFADEYKKWIRRSVQEPGSRGCGKCCEDISKTCTRCSAQEPCDLYGKSHAKEPAKAEEGCKDQEGASRMIEEDVVWKQYDNFESGCQECKRLSSTGSEGRVSTVRAVSAPSPRASRAY
ncbi:hypothetical protein O6H91_09G028700 [Diphasiastrum complanatum]|uniref:Uncharacterized protein n=1 Tax=Diphasiastrum complanatum TaxID=34168 RepID=A0ACC2CMN3_DIPCM|nr:hypothetical protein O6H91_09G028700 [Diphasiastrum complanatum]